MKYICEREPMINRTVIFLLFMVFLSGMEGCKNKKQPSQDENKTIKNEGKTLEKNAIQMENADSDVSSVSSNISTKFVGQLIIATVNGIKIYKDDFDKRVESQINPIQRQMPANFFEQYQKELSKKVLDEMVIDILIEQKSKQKGVVVTEQEIDKRISYIVQKQKMTLNDYQDMLKAKGEDFSEFKDKVRQNLIFEKLVAREYGPIDINDTNEVHEKRLDLAAQYIQKLKSEAEITYVSP